MKNIKTRFGLSIEATVLTLLEGVADSGIRDSAEMTVGAGRDR